MVAPLMSCWVLADHIANKMGKKPEEMGMKSVEESTVAPMKLLFGDGLKSVSDNALPRRFVIFSDAHTALHLASFLIANFESLVAKARNQPICHRRATTTEVMA